MVGQKETLIVKKTYTVQEVMGLLSICRSKAYELCNSGQFSILRIGRVIRVNKASFDDWFNNQ